MVAVCGGGGAGAGGVWLLLKSGGVRCGEVRLFKRTPFAPPASTVPPEVMDPRAAVLMGPASQRRRAPPALRAHTESLLGTWVVI
jgi:hypothetical protein